MIRLLAGHVGQAQTTLSLLQGDPAADLEPVQHQVFDNAEFSGVVALVADFLRGARVDAAALCLSPSWPRPRASTPPPTVRQADLSALLGTAHVHLLQEAQAALFGVPEVAADKLVWLQAGRPDPGRGSALVNIDGRYGRALAFAPGRVQATLAEQVPFAPRNAIERRLLEHLAERQDTVHLSHVLSAPGLGRLYDFLLHEGFAAPTALAEVQRAEDPNAEIARLGRRDLDRGCAAAVAFFADLLGAELSHLALQVLPQGGLYVTGELVRTLRGVLEEGDLLEAFCNREQLGAALEDIPLALVDEPALPLLGAQRAALCALQAA